MVPLFLYRNCLSRQTQAHAAARNGYGRVPLFGNLSVVSDVSDRHDAAFPGVFSVQHDAGTADRWGRRRRRRRMCLKKQFFPMVTQIFHGEERNMGAGVWRKGHSRGSRQTQAAASCLRGGRITASYIRQGYVCPPASSLFSMEMPSERDAFNPGGWL